MSSSDVVGSSLEQLSQLLQLYESAQQETHKTFQTIDKHVQQLTQLTEPLRNQAQQLTLAQSNIRKVEADTEELIQKLDISRKVQQLLQRGDKNRNWAEFIAKVEELGDAIAYLETRQMLSSAKNAVGHGKQVLQEVHNEFELQLKAQLKSFYRDLPISRIKQFAESQLQESELIQIFNEKTAPLARRLIEIMLNRGYESCLTTYSDDRIFRLQQNLVKIGVSIPQQMQVIQLSHKDLVAKIAGWVSLLNIWGNLMLLEFLVAKQAVPLKVLDEVLVPIQSETVEPLIQFVHDIQQGKHDVEIIFSLLQMHKVLVCVNAQLATVFDNGKLQQMGFALIQAAEDLARQALGIFEGFAKEVQDEYSSVVDIDHGTIHPRSAYVVRIVKRLFRDKDLESILFPKDTKYMLRKQLIAIVYALFTNLKQKAATLYPKDQSLQQLFLMNNVHFVVSAIESTEELKGLVGAQWVQKHRGMVEEYVNEFIKKSWEMLGKKTKVEGLGDVSSGDHLGKKDRQRIKDTFKAFNTSLSQLHKQQVDWCIPDSQLREAMIGMVIDEIVPAYKKLVDQLKEVEFTKHLDKYIIYTPEQIDQMLGQLFSKDTSAIPALTRSARIEEASGGNTSKSPRASDEFVYVSAFDV